MYLQIDGDQAECIEEYSRMTGKTPGECLGEALDDWIRTVAQAAIISQNEKFNIVVFPGPKGVQ